MKNPESLIFNTTELILENDMLRPLELANIKPVKVNAIDAVGTSPIQNVWSAVISYFYLTANTTRYWAT